MHKVYSDLSTLRFGEVKSETGNCSSHVDILGYKLTFRALYKTVLFSEFIYIALKHSFDLY